MDSNKQHAERRYIFLNQISGSEKVFIAGIIDYVWIKTVNILNTFFFGSCIDFKIVYFR